MSNLLVGAVRRRKFRHIHATLSMHVRICDEILPVSPVCGGIILEWILPNETIYSICCVVLLDRKEKAKMQIIIKGRQMPITQQLRQRIERKVQRLSRFVNGEARVEVTVTEEHTRSARDRFSVQLALAGIANPVHSEVSALNASTALDLVLDKVIAQLGRQKGKQTTVRRQNAAIKVLTLSRLGLLSPLDESDQQEHQLDSSVDEERNEQIWSRVMEIRRLPAKPMNDQEVIAQMEKSGASFFPFFNAETNSVNVMYRLDKGGYGLLVPAMEEASHS